MPKRPGSGAEGPDAAARAARARQLRERLARIAAGHDDAPPTPRALTDHAAEEQRRQDSPEDPE